MRAVVQKVQNASVTVDGLVISAIGTGILAWVGFGAQDNANDLNYMVDTLLTTRFFHSEHNAHRWTRTVMDCGYEVLVLSQISLYSAMYMEKPYFYQAMNARRSKPFYERFLKTLRRRYRFDKIREGRFGAGYTVTTQTRGPVFIVESFNQQQGAYAGPVGLPPYPQQQSAYTGPVGPPSYHQQQPPMYGPPPPPRDDIWQQGGGRPPPAYHPYPVPPPPPHQGNFTYQGLPPLHPLQPYPDYPVY